jgi:hypothetical protein
VPCDPSRPADANDVLVQTLTSNSLDPTEKAGIRATLIRCRVLAAKIANELRNKRPEHFADKLSMADIHASLERAADVLSTVKGSRARHRY